jgi:hypothetical protein
MTDNALQVRLARLFILFGTICFQGKTLGSRKLSELLKSAVHADVNARCAWQESHLAVLWTIGVFALNFGPVVVGPILDYVGPKLTAIFGELFNSA